MSKGDKTSLGDRMKGYEAVTCSILMKHTPVIIRLDGCHFHTFTRGFKKPYDSVLADTMQDTMKYLCANISGCKMGYTQSDEITLVLVDYEEFNTEPWFGNKVQKIASVAASMCTMYFNKRFKENVSMWSDVNSGIGDKEGQLATYKKAADKGAIFDARVFNVPRAEVLNNIYWRIKDCIRNSKSGLARAHFSHKELHGVSGEDMVTMVKEKTNINWHLLDDGFKYGTFCFKDTTINRWEFFTHNVDSRSQLGSLVSDTRFNLNGLFD